MEKNKITMRINNFSEFKMLEWLGEGKLPRPEYIKYLDSLQEKIIKEIKLPNGFKSDYDRGRSIKIHTGNKNDLVIDVIVKNDKIHYNTKPVKGIESGINIPFNNDINNIFKLIVNDLNDNKGIEYYKEQTKTDKPTSDDNDDIMSDIDKPILKKPIKRKRSISIPIIMSVLEDAFIVDDIDLKNISVEELIRRMLIASRK
ncbi:MAG: hypothetical protein WDA02_04960 [Saccharofermentanales bacterium]